MASEAGAADGAPQSSSHVGSFPVDPSPSQQQSGSSAAASPPPYGWQPYPAPVQRGPADSPAAPDGDLQTENPWIFSLEGATTIPLDIGARASLETPKGFRLATSFGVIPSAFAGVVNRLTERFDDRVQLGPGDGYTKGTAWRTQIGFRPSKRIGLYLDGGYSRVRLLGRFAFSAVTSRYPDAGFDLDTRLHNWLLELGYQTQVQDHWVLAIGAGVQGTIASNSEAEGYGTTPRASVQEVAEEAVEKFDQRFEKYGYMPTLILRVGYDLL